MATLQYNGTEYNILYIDPTIETAGDGSTPATALLDIPSPLTDKTCYLIRRGPDDEVYNVNMPKSWYEALYEIMFIGMPTQESPLWLALDEDVKEAWGADLGKYARVRCNHNTRQDSAATHYSMGDTNNQTLFKTNTIRNFVADSCYFYRDGQSPSTNSDARYHTNMFGFDYGSRFANVTFNNCKFGYSQYNLEDDDYITSNTDISTDTTTYPQYQCANYILGNNFNSFTFSNNIINHVYTRKLINDNGNWYHVGGKVIFINNANKVILNNTTYNTLYRACYTGSETLNYDHVRIIAGERSIVDIKNFVSTRIFTKTGAIVHNTGLFASASIVNAENITIKHKTMGSEAFEKVGSVVNTNDSHITLSSNLGSKICNLVADCRNTPIKYGKMFNIETATYSTGAPNHKIENILVKYNDNLDNQTFTLGTPLVRVYGHPKFWNNHSSDNNVADNNTFDISYPRQLCTQKSFIVNNVIVDCPVVNDYVLTAYRTGIKSDFINGRIYLASSMLDIKKLYNHFPTSAAAVVEGNCFLKCDELEVNLNDPNYKGQNQISWQRGSQSAIYIGKSNCIVADEVQNSGSNYLACMNSTLVCPNYIKPGQFFARNYNSFCKSWNVLRTGSNAQGSLRFNNNTNNQSNNILPLIIGQEPYTGFQIMPTSIGKKYVIGYIACKNFDDNELSNGSGSFGYWVNTTEKYTDLFNEEKINTKIHSYASDSFGWLVDNESTWSNDTNLKKYKLIVPIEVFNLEDPIEIKVWFNWYSVNGYCYIDPDFKLVDTI